jgi:hypothetical protein
VMDYGTAGRDFFDTGWTPGYGGLSSSVFQSQDSRIFFNRFYSSGGYDDTIAGTYDVLATQNNVNMAYRLLVNSAGRIVSVVRSNRVVQGTDGGWISVGSTTLVDGSNRSNFLPNTSTGLNPRELHVLQAGFSDEMLGLWSGLSFGKMVYDETRATILSRNTHGLWNEYTRIKNSYGLFANRQTQLLSKIAENLDMIDVMKAGSKRFAIAGLVIGAVDVANKGFTKEAVGLYALDAAMAGVAFLGPIGAGVSAVYFTGRFIYDLYEMSQK